MRKRDFFGGIGLVAITFFLGTISFNVILGIVGAIVVLFLIFLLNRKHSEKLFSLFIIFALSILMIGMGSDGILFLLLMIYFEFIRKAVKPQKGY